MYCIYEFWNDQFGRRQNLFYFSLPWDPSSLERVQDSKSKIYVSVSKV